MAYFILLVLAGAGCQPAPADAVVLQAGQYTLLEDELQALRQQGGYRELTDVELRDRLVEEARVLAYAAEHRFDTIVALQQQLAYAIRYQVSSVNGYLWNKQVKPLLQVSHDELKKAYVLRNREYWLDYLFYPETSNTPASEGVSVAQAAGEGAWPALRRRVLAQPGAQAFSGWSRFPFVPLAVYLPALVAPQVGKVYGPVRTLHGQCVVYVREHRPAAARDFATDSAAIYGELLMALQEDKIWRSQEQVMQRMQPVYHDEAIHSVAQVYDPGRRAWPGVDSRVLLMEYSWQDSRQVFTLADLQELVRYQPVFAGSLRQAGDVKKLLAAHLIGISLYDQANALGMQQDPVFLWQQKHYLRALYLQHYKQSFVYPRLSVPDAAVQDAYRHQPARNSFEQATVALYSYPDLATAMAARQSLLDSARGRTEGSQSPAVALNKELLIRTADTVCAPAVFDAIHRLTPGHFSLPVLADGQYVVIRLLHKQGVVPMPFKYAASDLRQSLLQLKERDLLRDLEDSFPIRINRLNDLLVFNSQ